MPRKKCFRRIYHSPDTILFKPAGKPMSTVQTVIMEMDELEAIRLADGQGLYHEVAAKQMGVSRQTFGRILEQARKKVATTLIDGMALQINKTNPTEGQCDDSHKQENK